MATAYDGIIFCNATRSRLEERYVNFFPVSDQGRVSELAMGSGHT
jgi:hypothetical protein